MEFSEEQLERIGRFFLAVLEWEEEQPQEREHAAETEEIECVS
jgi:hypothetical protein